MVKARASSVRSMVKGTTFIFAGRASDALIGFLFSIVAARLMGKDVYGLVGATIGIVSLISLLSRMGIPSSTTKHVSEYIGKRRKDKAKAIVANTFMLELVLGLLAAIICFGLADDLASSVFGKPELGIYLKLAAPLALFQPLTAGLNGIFQGYQRQEYFAATTSIGGIVRLVSATLFLINSPTVESAILGYLVGAIIGSILAFAIVLVAILPDLKRPAAPLTPELKRMLSFAMPVMLTASAVTINNWIGILFLAAFSPVEEVSWFSIAYGMVNIPVLVSMSLATAFYPIVSDLHVRGKLRLLRRSFFRVVKLTSIVMVPVVFILIAIGSPLILVLYGPEFLPAFLPFSVLAMWGLIRPIAAISNAISNGVGKPFLNTKANLITLALTMVLCTLLIPGGRPYPLDLIPLEGMMGAAWAITISFAIGMVLQVHYAQGAIRSRLPIRAWGKAVAASGTAAVIILLIVERTMEFLIGSSIMIQILVTTLLGLLGLVIYLGLIRLMKAIDQKDLKLMESMPFPMKGKLLMLFRLIAGGPR